MPEGNNLKILFVINTRSGNNATNWSGLITAYFTPLEHNIELFHLPEDCTIQNLTEKIILFSPQQVVAVGGDGTVKLVAACLIEKKIHLGILPAGSANGLAKELGISDNPAEALNVIVNGSLRKIHVTKVNSQICIHLSDIGFNAYVIKKFETETRRGMWGYLKASVKVLFRNPRMKIEMQIDKKTIKIDAYMIVIANATKYGSGAIINPVGRLDDELFEVIVIKKLSIAEIFKMTVSHEGYDPDKTAIFQTNALLMRSVKKAHFQVDGEYLGKVNEIKAVLLPGALEIIVPTPKAQYTWF